MKGERAEVGWSAPTGGLLFQERPGNAFPAVAEETLFSVDPVPAGTFTGTASGTLLSLTGSATGTRTVPITGTAAGTLPSLAQTAGTGLINYYYDEFDYPAHGDLPGLTGSASGDSWQIHGPAAGTLLGLEGAASGEAVGPTIVGEAGQDPWYIFMPLLTGSATGQKYSTWSTAAAGTLPSLTGSASGSRSIPTYGEAFAMMRALTGVAAGQYIPAGSIDGAGAGTMLSLEGAASGTRGLYGVLSPGTIPSRDPNLIFPFASGAQAWRGDALQ